MAGLTDITKNGTQYEFMPRSTAGQFSTSTAYAVGDYCYFDGTLYRCTTAHAAGAFVASHFTAVTIDGELKAKETEIENVKSDLSEETIAREALESYVAENYAKIDGYYDEMAVGSAEQLISTVTVEDKVPYLFRTAGGSADIGNRETDKIVGGTVAWNQLIKNGDFANGITNWVKGGGTASITAENGEATVTIKDAWNNDIRQSVPTYTNHVYLTVFSAKGNSDAMVGRGLYFATVGGSTIAASGTVAISATYNNFSGIMKCESDSTVIRIALSANGTPYAGESFSVKNIMLIDLTQLFGSTIADYIYSLEQATAGAGVAYFRKLFPLPYYAYNAGELISVEGLSAHEMVGFNQWDGTYTQGYVINATTGEPAGGTYSQYGYTDYIRIIPDTDYYFNLTGLASSTNGLAWYDSNKNYISGAGFNQATTNIVGLKRSPANASYVRATVKVAEVGSVCINLSWSGWRNGEYEPYVKHTYPLDSSLTLRGIPKLDSSNQLYYDGDTYESDGTVTRKYGIVDLGTLTWSASTDAIGQYFQTPMNALPVKVLSSNVLVNAICPRYTVVASANVQDKNLAIGTTQRVYIRDSAYKNASALKTALSGVYLIYELATPTEETADPYTNPQIVDDFGTEEYISTSIVPVGHETQYMANLRDKLQHLPDLADADGYYMINQSNKNMTLEHFRIPKAPTTDGTYILKAIVSGGTPTYTWEAES